jgi:iron complex transport system ATP-binding protein
LLRAVAGLAAGEGGIALDDVPLEGLGRRDVARRVAFVPQIPLAPPEMTVAEYVLLGRTPHIGYFGGEGRSDREAAARVLRRLDLVHFAGRRIGTLSGGERQRAVLARALAQEAPLLLLDEPTSALDIGRQQQALELVDGLRRDGGLTVLSAMHDLTLAGQYADRLVLLDGGRVVAEGSPRVVLTPELIGAHYGAAVTVIENGSIVVVPSRPAPA